MSSGDGASREAVTVDALPPEAVTAAAVAIHDVDCRDTHCGGSALGHCYELARAALEAAAPHLAAAEREACAQLALAEAASMRDEARAESEPGDELRSVSADILVSFAALLRETRP